MMLEKINKIWPRIGGFCGLIIIGVIIYQINTISDISQLYILYWLNLAILMFHEFEEYVFPGGFKKFANEKTVLSLDDPKDNAPITEGFIIVINLGFWIIFIIAALLYKIAPWLGFSMIIFNFINILGHLGIFQIKSKGYNPGVVTSIIMIPFLIYSSWIIAVASLLSPIEILLSIIVGIISGASLPIMGTIIKKKHQNTNGN